MSERAWTPGPWIAGQWHPRAITVRDTSRPSGGPVVARIAITADAVRADEGRANARVIAAAPELFEALDEAVHYVATWLMTHGETSEARMVLSKCTAALSKAMGEQQ